MAFWRKDLGPQAHLILVLEARVSVESSRRKEEVEFCGKEGSSMYATVCVSISATGARVLRGDLEEGLGPPGSPDLGPTGLRLRRELEKEGKGRVLR